MKYIVLETAEGQKLPIIFPEALTHAFVAGAMQLVVDTLDPRKDLRPKQLDSLLAAGQAKPVSAGFVSIPTCGVYGESESLGGLPVAIGDDARIILGDTVAFMPDALVESMGVKLRTRGTE